MTFSLHAFQNCDALNGDVAAAVKFEIPEKSRVPFCVVTRYVDSTEEVIRGMRGRGFDVGCKGERCVRCCKGIVPSEQRRKKKGEKCSPFGTRLDSSMVTTYAKTRARGPERGSHLRSNTPSPSGKHAQAILINVRWKT